MTEIAMPISPATSGTAISTMGMGALTGLGGYMGLGAKQKPCLVQISDSEVLISKDSEYPVLFDVITEPEVS